MKFLSVREWWNVVIPVFCGDHMATVKTSRSKLMSTLSCHSHYCINVWTWSQLLTRHPIIVSYMLDITAFGWQPFPQRNVTWHCLIFQKGFLIKQDFIIKTAYVNYQWLPPSSCWLFCRLSETESSLPFHFRGQLFDLAL